MVPGPPGDLPQDSGPYVSPDTVALVAAALEGRLLRLLPATAVTNQGSPDQTLADATHYSRAAVRQAIRRTRAAIGLTRYPMLHPRRVGPAGSTAVENQSQRRRDQERHRKRAQRHQQVDPGLWLFGTDDPAQIERMARGDRDER